MLRKVKYDYEFKLKSVTEVLTNRSSVSSIANKNGVDRSHLRRWVSIFKSKGRLGLLPRQNQNYTLKFKLKVLMCISQKSLSLKAVCIKFDIPSESTIVTWQKRYDKEGLLGLENKTRGRPTSMQFKRSKKKPDKPLSREEELLKENEHLRAENALLKKLQALIQAEENKGRKPL